MSERLEAVVEGRVQMVMYRDFAARRARGLGLVGEVKNLSDGSVCVTAEGPRKKLEQLARALKSGSLFSRVDSVTLAYNEPTGQYQTFNIAYD